MNAPLSPERLAEIASSAEVRPIAYAAKVTEGQLLGAHWSERSRAAEWPWDMWCRICHIRPTSHRTEAEALEAADRHVALEHAPAAEVHKLMTAGGLTELERLTARVAELEAERHATNEALSEATEKVAGYAARLSSASDRMEQATEAIQADGRHIKELTAQVAAVRAFAVSHEYRWLLELLDGGAL